MTDPTEALREKVVAIIYSHNAYVEKLWVPDPSAPYPDAVKWNDGAALHLAGAIVALPEITSLMAKAEIHDTAVANGWREMNELAQSAKLLAEAGRLRAALEPFAKFRLEGFDGPVLEVVPSSPDNPSRRIEPIFKSYFVNARSALTGDPL